jgi:hypothetical protein
MPTRRFADMALIGLACVAGGLIAILVALRLLALAGLPGLSLYHIPSGAMTPTIVVGDQIVAVANLYAGRPRAARSSSSRFPSIGRPTTSSA